MLATGRDGGAVIGVIVNPIAGYGARLAMHGTDRLDEAQHRAALDLGRATDRMRRTLVRLVARVPTPPALVAAPGALGGDLLDELGLAHELLALQAGARTTADDTVAAVLRMVADGVDCVAFAGGDGTAADIADGMGVTPLVGVPAGVKMHSAAFARTPEAAGDLLAAVVEGRVGTERRDLLDLVDGAPRVTGSVWVPAVRHLLQPAKANGPVDDAGALRALGRELAAASDPGDTWILGPGTTVAITAEGMGLPSTVAGFTVVDARGARVPDATEQQLFDAARRPGTNLLLGVVGGQGFLLGRGNHELSADVLGLLEPGRIRVVASASKLAALQPPVLHVDLGDTEPSNALVGYRLVHVSPGRTMMMKVVSATGPEPLY